MCHDGCARALAVESSLPRASMLTQEQIALESGPESNLERKASRDTGRPAAISLWFYHTAGVLRGRPLGRNHRRAADSTCTTRKCGQKAAGGRHGEQHKTGCVASDRRSRATHRKAHAPCTSCQVDRHEKLARSSSRNLRPGPRKPARHGAPGNVVEHANDEQRRPREAPKGTKHQP